MKLFQQMFSRVDSWVLSGIIYVCGGLLITLSAADVPLVPQNDMVEIDGQNEYIMSFRIDGPAPSDSFLCLEFDAYLRGVSYHGFDACLQLWCNDAPVSAKELLNAPEMFLRDNGMSSNAAIWKVYKSKRVDHFYLLYAPSLEAANSEECPFHPIGWNGTTFQFNLSPYLKQGDNRITFYNQQPVDVHNLLNVKSKIPASFSRIRLFWNTKKPRKQEDWWLSELRELNKAPSRISPCPIRAEEYKAVIQSNGSILIHSDQAEYTLDSYYSYPLGGYNPLGAPHSEPAEPSFQYSITSDGNTLNAKGNYYTVERKIQRSERHITVKERLVNLTDEVLGVIVRHHLTSPQRNPSSPIMVGGNPIRKNTSFHSPENPTVFLPAGKGGCGLMPANDLFQIHCTTFAQTTGLCGLSDPFLVLQPHADIELEFEIFPIAEGDFFTFINHLRNDLGLNGIKTNLPRRNLINMKSEIPARTKLWNRFGDSLGTIWVGHFSGFTNETPRKAIWKWGLAVLNDPQMCEERKELVEAIREQYPPARKMPILYCIMAPYGSNCADHLDDTLFKDWIIEDLNGRKLTEAGYRFFIPTKENDFGKVMTRFVNMALDEWHYDGIFFDYLEGAKPYFTYVRTDGVSGDIDEKTKKLIRQKASYQLLSQDYIIDLIRYIVQERGKMVVGNRSFYTRSTTKALKELVPVRFGEAASFDQITRNYLAPVPNSLPRTYRDVHKQFLSALYLGVLPFEYDFSYPNEDSPATAMIPFAVREIHRGYLIGTDKIITAISGDFTFGDDQEIEVKLYDENGEPKPVNCPIEVQNGMRVAKLRLSIGEIAIINKR